MTDYNDEDFSLTEDQCFCVVDGSHGRHIPVIFCQKFYNELEEQGMAEEADIIILSEEDENLDIEEVEWAWDKITSDFLLEGKYILVTGNGGDLFAVDKEIELPDWF